ncbi:hypothetical protein [Streptomyces sp. CAU 1734]|uniref:DeoR family transcriptional regulator n=1 Tax=Streptomyces sp. CAU 1734 TaxID=3140360 RepID=UPI0032607527
MSRDGARQIAMARALNVSPDTIRRDIQALDEESARESEQRRAAQARDAAPCRATPADTLSIGLDPDFLADLSTITSTGESPTAAIHRAVALWAAMHRRAWETDAAAPGSAPTLWSYQLLRRTSRTPSAPARFAPSARATDTAPEACPAPDAERPEHPREDPPHVQDR